MSVKDDFIGAKGSSSGSNFRNRPDNLRSTDTFEALGGLTSGRIKGLAPGGLKNLFIDEVPVEDGEGQATLSNFGVTLFDGDPTRLEPIKLHLGGSAGPVVVSLPVNNTTGGSIPGDWRFSSMSTPGVDFIDLRFIISALYRQDKKGIYEATASLEIELQPSGSSTWINPLIGTEAPTYNPNGININGDTGIVKAYLLRALWDAADTTKWREPNGSSSGNLTITGKTTQPFVKELRVAVPNTGVWANKTWNVRVRLIERDSYTNDQDEERRTIQWESIAGVSTAPIGGTEAWRGLAYLHIHGKASDQLTGIPNITGIFDLSMVKVPPTDVWDPVTRVYTGATWDGSTEILEWTQCPAFQLKNLIEDEIDGVSALSPGSVLNKWDTLEASKWYAEHVPDGKGGTHPRYSMNYLLSSAMSVNDLIQYVAGATGSFAYDEGDGKWRLIVDKPENAVALFTKENIIGEFNYAHTDMDSRFNDLTGVFRNEDKKFEEDRVRVHDQPHIDNYGRNHQSLALVGCTNRQEALRRLKLRQLVSLNETRIVTFTTNRQGSLITPFNTILVADGDLSVDTNLRSTGRMIFHNASHINLRDTVRLEVGVTYKIHVTIPNPNYNPNAIVQPSNVDWKSPTITITRNVTNFSGQRGDVKTINISSALPNNTPENAPVALEAVGLPSLPKQYRVMDVEFVDEEKVRISGIEVYTPKWIESDAVDEGVILAQQPSKIIPSPILPSSGMFSMKTYLSDFSTRRVLSVSWGRPGSLWLQGFKVEYRINSGPWIIYADNTQDTFIEIQQPQNGVYDFKISSIDKRGGLSQPLLGQYEVLEIADSSPAGYLTNEAHTVAADVNGTVSSFTGAGGSFVLDNGLGPVTTGVTYSIVSETGVDVSIDSLGVYTINSMSANQGTAVFRAVWQGFTIDKTYSISKSLAGSGGASAKLLYLISDRQIISYNNVGALNPSTQTTTFTIQGQNLSSSSYTVSMTTSAGVTINANSYLSSSGTLTPSSNNAILTGATSFTLSAASFDTARSSTQGVIVTIAHTDGVSDKVTVVKAQDGATGVQGNPGQNAVVGFLTNEAHTIAADVNGTVSSFTGAGGSFKLFDGLTALTSGVTYSVISQTGVSITINASTGVYTVTSMSSDTGTAALRALYNGVIIDKDYVISKARAGVAGSNSKTLSVISDRQTIAYDAAGVASPITQTTTFTTNKQNTSGTVTWSITDANGVTRTPVATYLSSGTGDSVTMTETQFNSARNGTSGVIVTGSITDGTTFSDKISIVRVQAGATGETGPEGPEGPSGPILDISAPTGQFIIVDGLINPASQTITVSATVAGVATSVTWNIRQPNGTLIRTAGPSTSVGVTQTDLGSHESLIIQGVYNSSTIATITLERKYTLSADYLNAISYTRSNAIDSGGVLLNAAANGVLTRDEKRTRVVPEWTTIQASYSRYQAEALARGVTTEKTAHTTAYNTLSTYLTTSTSILNTTHATAIDVAEFTNSFKNYYDAEAALVAACNSVAATTAVWTSVTGSSKPADNASKDINLVALNSAGVTIRGNLIDKAATGVWRVVYSREAYRNAAMCSFSFDPTAYQIFGLRTSIPTIDSVDGGKGLTFYNQGGTIGLYGDMTYVASLYPEGAWAASDVFSVSTDDVNAYFMRNGVVGTQYTLASLGISSGSTYRACGSIREGLVSDISITTATDNNFANIGGSTRPADNATVGAPAGTTVAAGAYFGGDGDTVANERLRTHRFNTSGRAIDGRVLHGNYNYNAYTGVINKPTITDTDNTGSVTVNVGSDGVLYPDWGGSITLPSGSIPGLAYNTTYIIYRNQADPTTSGESWGYTTSLTSALGPGKIHCGIYTTRASAGAPAPPAPPPPPSNGSSGGQLCVIAEAYVPTKQDIRRADEIGTGDEVIILDEETMEGTAFIGVQSNRVGLNLAVTLVTESNISLTVSHNTPITLRDRTWLTASEVMGYQVPVHDHGEFRWETVTKVIPVGIRKVCLLTCHQKTYAAGNELGRYILTHNLVAKP